MPVSVILDIDGTLVDTNYQHALAWQRALRSHGHVVQAWQIHRHIGMGGDKIVAALLGDEVEAAEGDSIRTAEGDAYGEMIAEVEPLDGARQLLVDLREEGSTAILASSAKQSEVDHYLNLLDARDIVAGWTSAADVEATKPEPDLIQAALAKAGQGPALMIGDSIWDVKAASAAGKPTLAVLSGGFSEEELREAGAADVVDSIDGLRLDRAAIEALAR